VTWYQIFYGFGHHTNSGANSTQKASSNSYEEYFSHITSQLWDLNNVFGEYRMNTVSFLGCWVFFVSSEYPRVPRILVENYFYNSSNRAFLEVYSIIKLVIYHTGDI
jgi:hypothetical protein